MINAKVVPILVIFYYKKLPLVFIKFLNTKNDEDI